MALTEGEGIGATMLVSPTAGAYPYPVYAGGGNGGGNNSGFGDGNGWWIVLLFILLAGGRGFGGYGNGGGGNSTPYIIDNNGGSAVQRGFDQAAVMSGINTLTSNVCNGFSDVQQSLCNGFAGVNATVNGGFANAESAANARAMANMQQLFGLSTQFSDCCCENRLAVANLNATVQRENCEDRYAVAQNTRDIIENANRNNQSILDKLCALELDAKNDRIADLERQLTMANLSASQIAQTAQIRAGQIAAVDSLYTRLSDCPVPTYNVPNPNCCPQNNCGCGCGSF